MTAATYKKISRPFRKNRDRVLWLNIVNLVLTVIVYIIYAALIIYFAVADRQRLFRGLFVPAVMFLFVSGLRKLIDRPRPYEVMKIKPLIEKDKKGESMPSRHVFSVFMIAMAVCYLSPKLSIPVFIIGLLIAAVRIVGGVHYLSDVVVGALIGIVWGILGFYIL